jgi:hypothetical protein
VWSLAPLRLCGADGGNGEKTLDFTRGRHNGAYIQYFVTLIEGHKACRSLKMIQRDVLLWPILDRNELEEGFQLRDLKSTGKLFKFMSRR